jgi:hypothetical protein
MRAVPVAVATSWPSVFFKLARQEGQRAALVDHAGLADERRA